MTFAEPKNFIRQIYLDSEVAKTPVAERILSRLASVPLEIVRDRESFEKKLRSIPLAVAKTSLWITRYRGNFLKPCPGTDENYVCCNYWVLNAQTNCPLDCTYCILQNYLTQPLLTVYTNVESIFQEVDGVLEKQPDRLFRIGTGELSDSLALDALTGTAGTLISYFLSKSRQAFFELKTKTTSIEHLPEVPRKNIVISWSLNPREVIEKEEFKTAPLEERLKAAALAIQKGYRVGFHFDPIMEITDWEARYGELIDQLTAAVPESEVVWISLGGLRYPADLKKTVTERFPHSLVSKGEMIAGLDGKSRYFRPVRTEMFRKIYQALRKKWPRVFIYFCMESQSVWKDVMGESPRNRDHLDYLFHESLSSRFPEEGWGKPLPAVYGLNGRQT